MIKYYTKAEEDLIERLDLPPWVDHIEVYKEKGRIEMYIEYKERISVYDMRNYCIKNNFFDLATNDEYNSFLDNACGYNEYDKNFIYGIARTIISYSSEYKDNFDNYIIEDIMFEISNMIMRYYRIYE